MSKSQPQDSEVNYSNNLEICIAACIKYTSLSASNKEKVAASSIRALGFIV